MSQTAIVVGAGPCGCLLALRLHLLGFNVEIYEKRVDFRVHALEGGISINLALSTRGLDAISRVPGLLDRVLKIIVPMGGRSIHLQDGSSSYHAYSRVGKTINSVGRNELNMLLLDACTENNIPIHFNTKVDKVDHRKGVFYVKGEKKEFDVLFGTDGAKSFTRLGMINVPLFNFHQYYSDHGYKELTIPTKDGKAQLEMNTFHIWPRGEYMLIALANADGSFTCTLFYPLDLFRKLDSKEKVEQFFLKKFPDVVELVPDLSEQFLRNPTGTLITIKCFPWSTSGRVLLLGDAAHAIIPFYGQGLNAALQDVTELFKVIEEKGLDNGWDPIFKHYESQHKPDADAIADMASENYIEMREKVRDKKFVLMKKVMHYLGDHFPDRYASRYELVSFTTLPYDEAKKRGEKSVEIAEYFTNKLDVENPDMSLIDLKEAGEMITSALPIISYDVNYDDPTL